MSNQNRQYVGSGKKVGTYDLINVTLRIDDTLKNAIYEYQGKKLVNLTIGGNRNGADQWGKTHQVWINDFKPGEKKETGTIEYPAGDANPDDIPF